MLSHLSFIKNIYEQFQIQGSVQAELNLPMHSTVPGSELTREPFRWDQRLYALVLRMAGTPPAGQESAGHVASDHSPIDAMCEVKFYYLINKF